VAHFHTASSQRYHLSEDVSESSRRTCVDLHKPLYHWAGDRTMGFLVGVIPSVLGRVGKVTEGV
jgi:hypothetical protein